MIYQNHGWFQEDLVSMTLKGREGAAQIQQMMENFRNHPPKVIGGKMVEAVEDYLVNECTSLTTGMKSEIGLPQSNVLKYTFLDGSWFTLRPSGTEPKIKFYFSVVGESSEDSQVRLASMRNDVLNHVKLFNFPKNNQSLFDIYASHPSNEYFSLDNKI